MLEIVGVATLSTEGVVTLVPPSGNSFLKEGVAYIQHHLSAENLRHQWYECGPIAITCNSCKNTIPIDEKHCDKPLEAFTLGGCFKKTLTGHAERDCTSLPKLSFKAAPVWPLSQHPHCWVHACSYTVASQDRSP